MASEPNPTLSSLEALLAQQTPALAKKAPKQLQELKALIQELKQSPKKQLSPASQKSLRNLFLWQLELKREQTVAQLEALDAAAGRGDAAALKAQRAFHEVLQVLDEAKKSTVAPGSGLQKLDAAAGRAKSALEGARSTPGPKTAAKAPAASARPAAAPVGAKPVAAPVATAKPPAPPAKLETFKISPGSKLAAPAAPKKR